MFELRERERTEIVFEELLTDVNTEVREWRVTEELGAWTEDGSSETTLSIPVSVTTDKTPNQGTYELQV